MNRLLPHLLVALILSLGFSLVGLKPSSVIAEEPFCVETTINCSINPGQPLSACLPADTFTDYDSCMLAKTGTKPMPNGSCTTTCPYTDGCACPKSCKNFGAVDPGQTCGGDANTFNCEAANGRGVGCSCTFNTQCGSSYCDSASLKCGTARNCQVGASVCTGKGFGSSCDIAGSGAGQCTYTGDASNGQATCQCNVPTTNCTVATGRAAGCSCVTSNQCGTGYCNQENKCATPPTNGNGGPGPGTGQCTIADGQCDSDCSCTSQPGECIVIHKCDPNQGANVQCVNISPEIQAGGQSVDAQALANQLCQCVQVDILNGTNNSCATGHYNGGNPYTISEGATIACPTTTANCGTTPVNPPPPGETPPPATPPPGPQCLNITISENQPQLGQQVTFTCGEVAGAARYVFRIQHPGGSTDVLQATGRVSQPVTVSNAGTYRAQCQICTGADDSSCHPFEYLAQ